MVDGGGTTTYGYTAAGQLWTETPPWSNGTVTYLYAAAVDSEPNPYRGIAGRNAFGLKPAPSPQPVESDRPPPPKIILTGLTTILGDKEVLMKLQMPTREGEAPKYRSLILAEGHREGEIRVLSIDMKTGDVTLDDFGTIVKLNLERDGAHLPGPPPPNIAPPLGVVPATSWRANTPVTRATSQLGGEPSGGASVAVEPLRVPTGP